MIVCGVCNRRKQVESQDVIPTGWYTVYAYDNDDGNNVTYYDCCSPQCLKIAAWRQSQEISGNVYYKG